MRNRFYGHCRICGVYLDPRKGYVIGFGNRQTVLACEKFECRREAAAIATEQPMRRH
jgi:hypothetical protein